MLFMKSMSPRYRVCSIFALLLVCSLCISCSGYIGYGVINWSVPEHGLVAGDVVPVFIQSNIGKVYVIGSGKDRNKRIEVPLWQLTLYSSASKARRAARDMEAFRYMYAISRTDGLPIRSQSDNTSRQIYRLRKDQKIRILRSGEGAPVVAGNAPLEGTWYEVLTDDGTTGWCFSYNLTVYDERDQDALTAKDEEEGPDVLLDVLLSRPWYPDHYRTMIESNRIDVSRINPMWGFFPGRESLVARLETADGAVSFPYSGISRVDDRLYRFDGTTLTVQVRRRDSIMVQYTDQNGMPQVHYFASLDTTADALIEAELDRRSSLLNEIRNKGPSFTSGNYGVLTFTQTASFLWSGYQILSPALIPSGSGGGGSVELRYFLHQSLTRDWDGVLSFQFDQAPAPVNFLYDLSDQGLRLEQVSSANIKDSVVLSRNLNPTVLFFTPGTGDVR